MRRNNLSQLSILIVCQGCIGQASRVFNAENVSIIEAQKFDSKNVLDSVKRADTLTRIYHHKQRVGKGERKRNKSQFKRHF